MQLIEVRCPEMHVATDKTGFGTSDTSLDAEPGADPNLSTQNSELRRYLETQKSSAETPFEYYI
jgi:hypothetical protein